MNGWIEKNQKLKEKINIKLSSLPPIFTEFCYDMEGDRKSYGTIKSYINYVENFMNYITNGIYSNDFYIKVKPVDIKKYFSTLTVKRVNGNIQKMSDDYQASIWSAINTFFLFLVMNGYINENPMIKTKRPKINTEHKVVYLNKTEISQTLNAVDEKYTGNMRTRDKAIIGLALSTGLRVSALVAINLEDIDWDNNTIRVIEKRNKVRTIQIGQNTKKLLYDWVQTRNEKYNNVDTTALFLSQCKKRITTNGVRDLIKKYTYQTGKHITPHSMRRSAATNMIEAGIELNTVSKVLGHSSPSITMRYIADLDKERERATDLLDTLI